MKKSLGNAEQVSFSLALHFLFLKLRNFSATNTKFHFHLLYTPILLQIQCHASDKNRLRPRNCPRNYVNHPRNSHTCSWQHSCVQHRPHGPKPIQKRRFSSSLGEVIKLPSGVRLNNSRYFGFLACHQSVAMKILILICADKFNSTIRC